jgi:hypothetical protein
MADVWQVVEHLDGVCCGECDQAGSRLRAAFDPPKCGKSVHVQTNRGVEPSWNDFTCLLPAGHHPYKHPTITVDGYGGCSHVVKAVPNGSNVLCGKAATDLIHAPDHAFHISEDALR